MVTFFGTGKLHHRCSVDVYPSRGVTNNRTHVVASQIEKDVLEKMGCLSFLCASESSGSDGLLYILDFCIGQIVLHPVRHASYQGCGSTIDRPNVNMAFCLFP